MKDIFKAVSTSRALDDCRGRARWQAPAPQARVDEALSEGSQVPWATPPRELRDRILAVVDSTEAGPIVTPPRRSLTWRPLALAAGLALAGGVCVHLAMRTNTPAPSPTPIAVVPPDRSVEESRMSTPISPPAARAGALSPATFVAMARETEPAVRSASRPLMDEARLIGQDTKRAVEGVFSALPVRFGE